MTARPPAHLLLLAIAAATSAGCYVPYRYGPGPGYAQPRVPAPAAEPVRAPAPAPAQRDEPPEPAPARFAAVDAERSACQVALAQGSPLLTGWPAADRATFEALARAGGVAVEFSGCTLRLLPLCRPGGRYTVDRTSITSDASDLASGEELLSRLPLGAASLEAELRRSGRLSLQTHVAGQARLEGLDPARFPAAADCAGATHVVTGYSVGAFALRSGGGDARPLQSAGDADTCKLGGQWEPHFNCRTPIQAFLTPITGRAEGPPATAWSPPQRSAAEAPPPAWPPEERAAPAAPPGDAWSGPAHRDPPAAAGTIRVDLLSGHASARWDVYYDDEVICTTPCTRQLDPSHPLLFRTRDEGRYARRADRVVVPHLLPFAEAGAVQVQAHPTAHGRLSTGIVFTSLGGMAAITGIALAGVGCGTDHPGMCTAGAITGIVGGLVTAGSISMIVSSLPHAEFRVPGGGTGRVTLGPGGAVGTF